MAPYTPSKTFGSYGGTLRGSIQHDARRLRVPPSYLDLVKLQVLKLKLKRDVRKESALASAAWTPPLTAHLCLLVSLLGKCPGAPISSKDSIPP